jgi:hypothetical protein
MGTMVIEANRDEGRWGGDTVDTSRALGRRISALLAAILCALAVGASLSANAALSQPVFCGQEPAGGPLLYNPIPAEGEVIARDDLSRAGATIETQHDIGVAWAGIFVDGEQRPSALMGPTRYCQSTSADITDLMPGVHNVRVVFVDSEGRVGGYAWTFAVV